VEEPYYDVVPIELLVGIVETPLLLFVEEPVAAFPAGTSDLGSALPAIQAAELPPPQV
jgi:hypothetical protein